MSQFSLFDLSEDQLIHHATAILEQRLGYRTERKGIDSPGAAKDFVRLRLAQLEHEVFACLFLDNRHRLVAFEELFRGTIDGASVHPREVVKRALHHNAAAVILAHYVARNIMGLMCPVFLCSPRGRSWRGLWTSDPHQGT
jgi:DNA repair protein RadC